MRVTPRLVAAACVVAGLTLFAAPAAIASHTQVAILQDDTSALANPGPTLQEMRHLGAEMLRVTVRWSSIAPAGDSRHRPKFNALDPNAYPGRNWAPYDALVRDATADGIKVLFVPSGFAPLWAQGSDPGRYAAHNNNPYQAFEPSASQYGMFVHALGVRYGGNFTPRGSSTPLPRVSYWELYNEPNFGEDIAPQAIDGSSVLYAPRAYRALADAGWGALSATGHRSDTILIGALAARGAQKGPARGAPQGLPGSYGETKPLAFIRALYCLNNSYRPYRGYAAAARGCPTTAAGSRRFRAENPVLFQASGFSDHPYPNIDPPNRADSKDPSYAEFSELNRLASTLDRIQRLYRSGKRFPIWNTEYGYITDPPNANKPSAQPKGRHYVSPATAAYYLNWSEYLSWRNPRIASTMQYQLYDPNPSAGQAEFGGFSSGLVFFPTFRGGTPKATYYAYRLPIFLPSTETQAGRKLQVWGAARPAPYALADTGQAQYVQIQWAPGASNSWRTLTTVPITDPHGYFDTSVAFPGSGQVRIAWTYPPTDLALSSTLVTGYTEPLGATTSRTVQVTIR
jgi:hypothetical protein